MLIKPRSLPELLSAYYLNKNLLKINNILETAFVVSCQLIAILQKVHKMSKFQVLSLKLEMYHV